jgi:hypothetical protein
MFARFPRAFFVRKSVPFDEIMSLPVLGSLSQDSFHIILMFVVSGEGRISVI